MSGIAFGTSEIEFHGGFDPVKFGAIEGAYEPVAKLTANATLRAIESADRAGIDEDELPDTYSVPAVQMIIDATMSILSQPAVERRMPREIRDRSTIAEEYARRVATVGATARVFTALYGASPALTPLLNEERIDTLEDCEYLGSLGANFFFDITGVAGGAHRVLARRQLSGRALTESVRKSTGLLSVAGITRTRFHKAWTALGYPYVLPRHLVLEQSGDQAIADFEPGIKRWLRTMGGSLDGCPSQRMRAPEGGTLMRQAWGRAVDFLVPEDAASRAKNTRLPRAS